MKKLLNAFIVLILSAVVSVNLSAFTANLSNRIPFALAQNLIPASSHPTAPKFISIPKLNLSTITEAVGEDYLGRMDIPENENNVAWWKYGAKPGEDGSLVLAGHVDRSTGGPGIFYALDSLQPGDQLTVTDQLNRRYTYTVVEQATYSDSDFPLETVFAQKDQPRLNLITCAGSFNPQTQNYQQRTVVYTILTN